MKQCSYVNAPYAHNPNPISDSMWLLTCTDTCMLCACRFPWWPGIVISPTADMPSPTTSSSKSPVLVRFLGTHDASWVDPEKAVSAWGTNQTERSTKTKAAAFVSALKEANAYANTGTSSDGQ